MSTKPTIESTDPFADAEALELHEKEDKEFAKSTEYFSIVGLADSFQQLNNKVNANANENATHHGTEEATTALPFGGLKAIKQLEKDKRERRESDGFVSVRNWPSNNSLELELKNKAVQAVTNLMVCVKRCGAPVDVDTPLEVVVSDISLKLTEQLSENKRLKGRIAELTEEAKA